MESALLLSNSENQGFSDCSTPSEYEHGYKV